MRFGSVQEFQGLKFTTNVESKTNLAAIVGRNGVGKTRMLKAIADGRVEVFVDSAVVPQENIRLLNLSDLQPSISFNFDPLEQRKLEEGAIDTYRTNKGKFNVDPQISVVGIYGREENQRSKSPVYMHLQQVAHTASCASKILGKDINELTDADITDFSSSTALTPMGTLNVAATMQAYRQRLEQNDYNEFRNHKYKEQRPYRTPEEIDKIFGPPPWETFNQFLHKVLEDKYYIEAPPSDNIATYDPRLYRCQDKVQIDPAWLSSGEKVLMWLCLSMYASNIGRVDTPPKLLLLDEPDGALHPQMVQKLHMVLKYIADRFGCGILFTTHSPTSIALFDETGPIWQVSECDLVEIDKNAAIRELLVGLDQVSIHYTKCRQVYVESHKDADIYTELFRYLRRWGKGIPEHIALSFIPAAWKLPDQNIRDIFKACFGDTGSDRMEAFIQALNGQGDCVKVIGAVESLTAQDGIPVHGIIDWDRTNKPRPYVHVLGENLFYSIENAVLNPLTLGIYLLHQFLNKLKPRDYGLDDNFDPRCLYTDTSNWQSIADGVMRRVLNIEDLNQEDKCAFLSGGFVYLDRRYTQMKGHELEKELKEAYPFLKKFNKNPTLMMTVAEQCIQASSAETMPMAFAYLFTEIIQAAPTRAAVESEHASA